MRLLALLGALAAPAAAQEADPAVARALIADAAAYDDACRGGSGDDADTWYACGARDYAGYALGLLGYCYVDADESFVPCARGGTRLSRPVAP